MLISCVSYELPKRTPGSRATFLHMIQSLKPHYKHRQNPQQDPQNNNNEFIPETRDSQYTYEENHNGRIGIEEIGKESTRDLDFRYDVTLDRDKEMRLYWDVNPPLEVITFRLQGNIRRDDFLGFGFSPYGEVANADFFVMYTQRNGHHYFRVSCMFFLIKYKCYR